MSLPLLKGSALVGGILGEVDNSGLETVTISPVFVHLGLENSNALPEQRGCVFGDASEPERVMVNVLPEAPEDANANPTLCRGRDSIPPPSGPSYFQDVQGIYRVRKLERWFGPLRDANLSIAP